MHCGMPLLNPWVRIKCTFPWVIAGTVTQPNIPSTGKPQRTLLTAMGMWRWRWMTGVCALVNDRVCVCVYARTYVCVCTCASVGWRWEEEDGWSCVDRIWPRSHVKRGFLSMQHRQSRPAADDLGLGWNNQYFSRYEILKHHWRCI